MRQAITFDAKSRDDIPRLLRALQHIWTNLELRNQVFQVLDTMTSTDKKNGRPGMAFWKLRVCVLQDQFGFTLHHQVMQKQTDDQVTVPMAVSAKKRFPALNQVSYDKGFWSPGNLEQLVQTNKTSSFFCICY